MDKRARDERRPRGVANFRDAQAPRPGFPAPLDIALHYVHMHEMDVTSTTRLAQNLLDSCMCHKTRMAARAITRTYDDALRKTGLRATQLAVLAAVGARGALSIQSLADVLGMDRTTLTRNLRPLEDKGLVLLAPEARHRARMLELTAAGRSALGKALPLWEDAQRMVRRRLGQQRWPAVQDALTELTEETRLPSS